MHAGCEMRTQYRCRDEARRRVVAAHPSLNGIDYLEVLDTDRPSGSLRQQTLLVHCFRALPVMFSRENVHIIGGVREDLRINPVQVLWAFRAADVPVPPATQTEKDFFAALPNPERVLVVHTSSSGDFSQYRLCLVESPQKSEPPANFDPQLSEVEFSFKVECPSEFDCRPDTVCPPERSTEPPINYLAKDYASFRRLMLDRLALIMPGWRERNPADLGIVLVELLAYSADDLSYYQDAVATEAYLGTARRRVSVRRHARLLDYPMHEGCNSRVWVQVRVTTDVVKASHTDPPPLPRGTRLLTRIPEQPVRLPNDPTMLHHAQAVFETMHAVDELLVAYNELPFYTWGDKECCLPKGATRATLKGHYPSLKKGDVLLFEEVLGPRTGQAEDADPARRHLLRLTDVVHSDPNGNPLTDRLNGQPITEIQWAPEDALPFSLCISSRTDAEHGQQYIDDVSVSRGNVVLADHGLTIENEGLIPEMVPATGRYRPRLYRRDITHRVDHDQEVAREKPAAGLLSQDPRAALPQVKLHGNGEGWIPGRDLLNSDRFAREFVVEKESDGRAYLRFGDGVLGRKPAASSRFTATYRVGNGSPGNVGADAIAHVVTAQSGIEAVRNPLPAEGGTDPEPIEQVRLNAPQAFRIQERAVTEADYEAAAQRHPEVQRAAATLRWTGSWPTMFVTVDRKGGQPVGAAFEEELRVFLERFRLAGCDLEIDAPRLVSLDIALTVCVEPGYFHSDVKKVLLETFSNQELPDGRQGFFHPDNFTFGQPVYLSQVVAAAMKVPGVAWVKPIRFQRWGQDAHGELEDGRISFGRVEIARLDNDPSTPENGKFDFQMLGGL